MRIFGNRFSVVQKNFIQNSLMTSNLITSVQQLCEANKKLSFPFLLNLEKEIDSLSCENIKRLLPRRRIVVCGTWKKEKIVAKIFFDIKKAKRDFERELKGANRVLKTNILSPKLLYAGRSSFDKNIYVIVFNRIALARDFSEVWKTCQTPEEKKILLVKLVKIVAGHHRSGLLQSDAHLDNFLVSENKIFTIDCASFRKNTFRKELTKKQSLNNLGLLFAQFKPNENSHIKEIFRAYVDERNWIFTEKLFDKLMRSYIYAHSCRIKKYLKKIFRECTEFYCKRTWHLILLCKKYFFDSEMERFLNNIEESISNTDVEILKPGRTCTVLRINIGDRCFIVKRYNIKNFWHRLKRCFKTSRAIKSWRNAHHLLCLGIPTARPVAIVENRFGPFCGKSYFIMEALDGISADKFFASQTKITNEVKVVAEKIVKLLKSLAEMRIKHGDMKASNIILVDGEPVLIDLDAVKKYPKFLWNDRRKQKDIKRFMKNWEKQAEVFALFRDLFLRVL